MQSQPLQAWTVIQLATKAEVAPGNSKLKEKEHQPQGNGLGPPLTVDAKAEVQLTPPTQEPASVEENVTKASVIDIKRYLRWADKLLKGDKTSDKAA